MSHFTISLCQIELHSTYFRVVVHKQVNMKVVWIHLIHLAGITLAIQLDNCKGNIEKLSLCHTDENGYDMSGPSQPYPSNLTPSVEIHDIVEVHPEEKSVTMLVEIFLEWNDARLELKSADPNE